MARRIVRTLIQFTILSFLVATVIFFLDLRYRVLPQSIHHLLPEHHAGTIITDITMVTCSSIILSSCRLDARDGWTRIEKDVYLGKSWVAHGYVHVQTKKEEEFQPTKGEKVVVDLRVGRIKPKAMDGAGDKTIEWESRPGGFWIKRQAKKVDATLTALDVLFGPDATEVRGGWQLKGGSLTMGEHVRLSVRRGSPEAPRKPAVRVKKDHKFKIIQVSDLHLSTGVGKCREPQPPKTALGCEADPRTLDFISRILDEEKPDLAVLSGDQVNGETAEDAQTAIFKFAEPFIKRKIPYATILGNHDDEGNLSREQIMKLTASLPYSLSEIGPNLGPIITDKKGRERNEGGVGNYHIEILAHSTDHSALTLYLFDTHSYSPDPDVEGYDFVKQSQIDWYKEKHNSLKEQHNKYSYMHLNMAFIHIPLPEYRHGGTMVGERREPPTAPQYNSKFKDALAEGGVVVVSAGHDHANDYCLADEASAVPWMCYAGGSGLGGYGGWGGYNRRVRLFEIDGPAGRITTWKRVEWEDKGPLDAQTLVEGGKVVVSS